MPNDIPYQVKVRIEFSTSDLLIVWSKEFVKNLMYLVIVIEGFAEYLMIK